MPQPAPDRHRLTWEWPAHRFLSGVVKVRAGHRSTGLSLKTPNSGLRKLVFAAGFTCAALATGLPAQAQGITAIFQDGQFPTSRYAGTTDVIITEHVDFDRDPDANYSGRAYLQVDGFSARQTSLLRFPFGPSALPPGANITGFSDLSENLSVIITLLPGFTTPVGSMHIT